MRLTLLLLATLVLGAAAEAQAPARRALLVGINTYADPLAAGPGARPWPNLRGPVNDVRMFRSVLVGHAGFAAADVDTLTEGAATRAGILAALGRLVREARPGDHLVFFYAGHGSRVRNTASDEMDGMDEAIVPADAAPTPGNPDGAPFIRDKELRDLFDIGLVNVTAGGADGQLMIILDSCHSGSSTRGGPPDPGQTRQIDADPRQVVDDPSTAPAPETLAGSLIFSAAQNDEPAIELPADGARRGVFTRALVRAILSTPRGAPARVVFERATAILAADPAVRQTPTLVGTDVGRPLFGASPDAGGAAGVFSAIAIEADSARVLLQGGVFEGLGPGALLTRIVASDSSAATVRLRVTSADDIVRSRAEAIEGDLATVSASDLFRLDAWAPPPGQPLRLYVPPALASGAAIRAAGAGFQSACGPACVADPMRAVARGTFAHLSAGWSALTEAGPSAPAGSPAEALRNTPAATAPYLSLPPTAEIASALAAALATFGGVETVTDIALADYWLDGRVGRGDSLEYRWLAPAATLRDGAPPAFTPLPAATDWTGSAARLADTAFRMGRLNGWLHLESPPDAAFPLQLEGLVRLGATAAENVLLPADATRAVVLDQPSAPGCFNGRGAGPCYSLSLGFSAEGVEANRLTGGGQRFVYVFVINGTTGQSSLLYPSSAGGDNNRFSVPESAESTVLFDQARRGGVRFGFPPPRGEDTFFLLTSDTAIPDPRSAFNSEAIALRTRGPSNPLGDLLARVGTQSRGEFDTPVPTTWSISRLTVDLSIPPAP